MENNEIMQRLLQEDSHSDKKSENKVIQTYNSSEIPMSKIRVVTAKYKVLIIVLLIIIGVFGLVRIPEISGSYDIAKEKNENLKAQLSSINIQIKEAKDNDNFRQEIEENEKAITNCINNTRTCFELADNLKRKTGSGERDYSYATVPVSYLQVHSLYAPKMAVDEKRILRNLNEYLIKQEFGGNPKEKVGDILKISIGDPETIYDSNEHFVKVPLEVTIEFENIDGLMGFLENIEKKIIETTEDRILYKVQAVTYDIIANDEPQTTDIEILAYYYYDEKFDNINEENAEANNETNEEENNNSAPISDMIKNS